MKLYKCKFILTACPEISHCLENHCTALGNNHCVKCDGEVKPDPPFWAAYTRRPSVNKLCQRMYVYLKQVYIYFKYMFHTIQNLDINILFCLNILYILLRTPFENRICCLSALIEHKDDINMQRGETDIIGMVLKLD